MRSSAVSGGPTIVAAFQSALLHQALGVLVVLVLLAIAWNLLRGRPPGALETATAGHAPAAGTQASRLEAWAELEPSGRRLLRISFGLLWIFDGILQGQTSMPLGMTGNVIKPAASSSPEWVRHVVSLGATVWSDHPIVASSAVVWIQLGIGLWLLVAPRGAWSRAAGFVSVAWGLVVWVFAEAFGGLFAPGVSWMFGAPGALLLYCLAGALIALDDRRWETGGAGRLTLNAMGGLFLVMAAVQALPRTGFWEGRLPGSGVPGPLASRVATMAALPQPRELSSALRSFSTLASLHGFGVNLALVVVLTGLGLAFVSCWPPLVRAAVAAAAAVCLADWVLVQDMGFLGGTGTNPNSMIPMFLLIAAGYVGLTRTSVEVEVLSPELELPANLEPDLGWMYETPLPAPPTGWRERVRARPAYVFRVLAALGAVVVVLMGAAPMALASLDPQADPIVYVALDGSPVGLHERAPTFVLSDQFGRPVSLSALRGRVVVLAFLDPVGTEASPGIAQGLREAAALLAPESDRVAFVGVVTNPLYRSVGILQLFDETEGLASVPNWLFLSGPPPRLREVWRSYGVTPQVGPAGSGVAANYRAIVLDPSGEECYLLNADPAPSTATAEASFASELAATVRGVLATP